MMNQLINTISLYVKQHIQSQAKNISGAKAELRAVFNGPPLFILETVFEHLTQDGGIEVILGDGRKLIIPVLLQVDEILSGGVKPALNKSGLCDHNHLLDLRNSEEAKVYLCLVPPEAKSNLSLTSTRSEFGISSKNNLATATIADWLDDDFVSYLINHVISQNIHNEEARIGAEKLLERAALDCDRMDSFDASREHAWRLISRVFSISGSQNFLSLFSAACGYPSTKDSQFDVDSQRKVLDLFSKIFEKHGFDAAKVELVAKSELTYKGYIAECLDHISKNCDIPTAFKSSETNYYCPVGNEISIGDLPAWWDALTVDVWLPLFEEEKSPKAFELKVHCDNSLASPSTNIYIVKDSIEISMHFPDEMQIGQEIMVTRVLGTSAASSRSWQVVYSGNKIEKICDQDLPDHKKPFKYIFEIIGHQGAKKKTLQIISLKTWIPGLVTYSRSCTHASIPVELKKNKDGISLEAGLELSGFGRHYIDILTGPGVEIIPQLSRSDSDGRIDDIFLDQISKISDQEYGFEVNIDGNCFYQFELVRFGFDRHDQFRLNLDCQEVSPEECASEFERLIKANRQGGFGKNSGSVLVNTQFRCADLESWVLDSQNIARSYYPLVISDDYAFSWKPTVWNFELNDTIFSSGKFLNDPRPAVSEFSPPDAYIQAREKIAKYIRGEDGSGLIEAAKLGELIINNHNESEFLSTVETYLQSYLDWLSFAPDVAIWSDLIIFNRFEKDGQTLIQEPDAVIVSPMHPIKFAWQCAAQRSLFEAARKLPCPAASILDPDCVPDSISLPLRLASGAVKRRIFFSVESSSDYWSVLWNSSCLDRLSDMSETPPFHREFGIQIGGLSSGFNISQVHKSLNDVSDLLHAKPVLNIMISSSSGLTNPCNEGVIGWVRSKLLSSGDGHQLNLPRKRIQILDERPFESRPMDTEIANLTEDTGNSVKWFSEINSNIVPDIGIIAQLQTTNESIEETKYGSSLSEGGLIRRRIREQHGNARGAFLTQTRMALPMPPSDDGLLDKLANAIRQIENQEPGRYGHSFAPSVSVIQNTLSKSIYAAVSSSAIDPACFLGKWLDGAYLWDYDLPSYSSRAGDNNGYYLLSKIKQIDIETFKTVLNKLPNCSAVSDEILNQTIMEVARRGIPTVRGLSKGDLGASGDLGMFVASRLLQDVFRPSQGCGSLLDLIKEDGESIRISLLVPVDPFKGYLEDLTKALSKDSNKRPDLLILGITLSGSKVVCRLTPVEVKYRSSIEPMTAASRVEALKQAKSLSELFIKLLDSGNEKNLDLWRIASQHLLVSMVEFGFRVYSQQLNNSKHASDWPRYQSMVISSILSNEAEIQVDATGRLIVVDGSRLTEPSDSDGDGFYETISVTHHDAGVIAISDPSKIYDRMRLILGDWGIYDHKSSEASQKSGSEILTRDSEFDSTALPQSEINPSTTIESIVDAIEVPVNSNPHNKVCFNFGASINNENDKRILCLSDTNLNHLNIGVVGDLGTGKTQLLKSLIYQINKSSECNLNVKPNLLIFDYKKDYSTKEFVESVGAKVIKPYHLPLNLFDLSDSEEQNTPWLHRFRFFADVLDKVFSGVGHVQRANLKTAIKRAYEDCQALDRSPTIYDVHQKYHEILGPNKADSVSSIIDDLVDMELFDPNISSNNSSEEFLKGVVVISLNELGQDDKTKNMLVAIMLNIFYEHMLKIPKRPFYGKDNKYRVIDSYLLVDEADNIMRYEFDVLRKILLQGREFGVGVILASQYLRHFKAGATDYREPLLSWFIHKVPNITAQELSALGFSGDQRSIAAIAERVKSLALHECLYKSFDNSGEIIKGKPFYKYIQDK